MATSPSPIARQIAGCATKGQRDRVRRWRRTRPAVFRPGAPGPPARLRLPRGLAEERHGGGGRADRVSATYRAGSRIHRHQRSGAFVCDPDAARACRDCGRGVPDRHGGGDGVARGVDPGERPSSALTTHTAPSPAATGPAPAPTPISARASPLTGSILKSWWASGSVTHSAPNRPPPRPENRLSGRTCVHPAARVECHDRVAARIGYPDRASTSCHRDRAPADADRLNHPVGRRIDPGDASILRVGYPDRARRIADPGGQLPTSRV